MAAGQAGDVHGPGAAGVDDLARADLQGLLGTPVAADRGADDAVADVERQQFGVRAVDAAIQVARMVHVGQRQVEGVDGGVGHAVDLEQAIRQLRLECAGLSD